MATITAPSTKQLASLKALVTELPTTERIAVSRYFGITGTEPGDLFSIAAALSVSVLTAAVLVSGGHKRLMASVQTAEVATAA